MAVLHEEQTDQCRITITEEEGIRYLYLDGCEEGAMAFGSHEPVFNYLWFHKCSAVASGPIAQALVLGAGAFTASKCVARDHPFADIDTVDSVPELGNLARRFFRLDDPAFARIRFFGMEAASFLTASHGLYDFIFDDLFDGFQHVPTVSGGREHFALLSAHLAKGGVCIKNMIWYLQSQATQAACAAAARAWRESFPASLEVSLGAPSRGHNRMLIGWAGAATTTWRETRARLGQAGFPRGLLDQVVLISE